MLSYPPHSAQQQQATSPMSLTFTGQTQRHQQQQQSKDEPTTDKTPATADDEELQKPLKSTEADIQSHLTATTVSSKDRASAPAADMSDSNVSDYEYSYDDEEEDKDDNVDAMPQSLVVGPRRTDDCADTTQAAAAAVGGGVGLKRCDCDDDDDDDHSASQRAAKSRRLDCSAPTSLTLVRPTSATPNDSAEKGGADQTTDSHSDDSPESPPFQTEIKTQRPLGLLAQHRLQTSATTSYRGEAIGRDRTTIGRAVDETEEQQRLREMMFGRRLTQAELEAAVAMQERMSGGGYCGFPASVTCSGLMTSSLPPTPSSAGVGLDFSMTSRGYDTLMDRRFVPSPPLSSASPHSANDDPASPLDATSSASGHRHWTFQEQFKQLYEMSDDVKRKEFLDELFTFMQKRGTPVNRIPIMAKQTLDLYELFRLVVSKGGLVEVINKKLWREITKGLNLPSSITSAAFTLRTQYMKYLYPFECEKLKLSTLAELQYAVDGNRREGRRPSYGGGPAGVPGDFSPLPPPPPPVMTTNGAPAHVLHQASVTPALMPGLPATTPQHIADGLNAAALAAAAVAARTNGLGLVPRDSDGMVLGPRNHQSTVNQLRTLAECDARAMESAARAMQEVMVKRIEEASSRVAAVAAAAAASSQTATTKLSTATPAVVKVEDVAASTKRSRSEDQVPSSSSSSSNSYVQPQSGAMPPQPPPPAHLFLAGRNAGVGAAHIKLTSRNDGRTEFDTSIVASMEVNGIVYQGVLFAQPPNIVGARI